MDRCPLDHGQSGVQRMCTAIRRSQRLQPSMYKGCSEDPFVKASGGMVQGIQVHPEPTRQGQVPPGCSNFRQSQQVVHRLVVSRKLTDSCYFAVSLKIDQPFQ
eukprot:6489510-Amphidinium_carterae.1